MSRPTVSRFILYVVGNRCYNIWDCGSGILSGLGSLYYIDADIAFIFGYKTEEFEVKVKEKSPKVVIKTVDEIKKILDFPNQSV